jgi:hypothetical protein
MRLVYALLLFGWCGLAWADGTKIDKVYDPYVQQLENEVEYRFLSENNDGAANRQRHKLGYGSALSDRFFAEIYGIAQDAEGQSAKFVAVEAELKWQLTEQGEYGADWGVLFEIERDFAENQWEYKTTLIALYEYGRWVSIANLGLAYEWGGSINNELESQFSGQVRYRQQEIFEPGLELYLGQGFAGAGPIARGSYRIGAGKRIAWNLGMILRLDAGGGDPYWKLDIEYEF